MKASFVYKMLIIMLCLCSGLYLFSAAAGARVLFSLDEPVGDENGPGSYQYPTHKHFAPHKGLFDLTCFVIKKEGEYFLFELSFVHISDPWQSRYGFSHPLIEIYFDNREGGDTLPFRPGSRIRFPSRAPWDFLLKCTGWWIRGFSPEDRQALKEDNISWNAFENPFDLEGADGRVLEDGRTVQIKVPVKYLDLTGNIYVLIGSFDPFGQDHFRDVAQRPGSWEFGGGVEGEYHPRVIDILDAKGKSQKEILGSFSIEEKQYALLEPIPVGKKTLPVSSPFIWIGFVLLLIGGVLYLKKNHLS